MQDDGGHEPPGSVEQIVMSREMVAKRRSKLAVCHGNSGEQGVEMRCWREGAAAGVGITMIRPSLSCFRQSATSNAGSR